MWQDNFRGAAAEFLNLEPHNSWFTTRKEPSVPGKNLVVRIEMSEHFLNSHKGKMRGWWNKFTENIKLQESANTSVSAKEANETRFYSTLIQRSCGCTGEAIHHKLQYLQQNNGVDEFGRTLPGYK